MYTIYAIKSDCKTIYIGKTANFKGRVLSHLICISTANKDSKDLYRKLFISIKSGCNIQFVPLEYFNDADEASEREIELITSFLPGSGLLNTIYNLEKPVDDLKYNDSDFEKTDFMYDAIEALRIPFRNMPDIEYEKRKQNPNDRVIPFTIYIPQSWVNVLGRAKIRRIMIEAVEKEYQKSILALNN